MIREATTDDIFDLLVLARAFSKEAPAMHKWDKEKTEQMLKSCIAADNCTILVIDKDDEVVGGLVGMVTPLFMSNTVVASELAWFVDKDNRGREALKLVRAFEDWAEANGAEWITMADIEGIANLGKLYGRLGYEVTETAYSKRIK